MHIAIEGCAHGELETIYASLENIQTKHQITIDLLICCGDFQAVRNMNDLQSMACSAKFRTMNSFYKYYSGEVVAPITTIFIGGNHEAASHLYELPFGGWVAPNIYYLGNSGSVMFGGLRIAGISGIYKDYDHEKPRFEKPPFTDSTMRSAYHQRNSDVLRLAKLGEGSVDMLLSHDWPIGITKHGNEQQLLRFKSFFAEDIKNGQLGSPAVEYLMNHLQPKFHFAAHLHCRFPAIVKHASGNVTKFLALDKVLPNRHFLQILELPTDTPKDQLKLQYDSKWLAILKLTHMLEHPLYAMNPPPELVTDLPQEEEIKDIHARYESIYKTTDLVIPENFVPTQPAHNPANPNVQEIPLNFTQTNELMELLGVDNIFHNPPALESFTGAVAPVPVDNPEEIDLDDLDD